jgi:hypothetical protein
VIADNLDGLLASSPRGFALHCAVMVCSASYIGKGLLRVAYASSELSGIHHGFRFPKMIQFAFLLDFTLSSVPYAKLPRL